MGGNARGGEIYDFGNWPIVFARMPGASTIDMSAMTTGLSAALERQEAFVLVIEMADYLADPDETGADKKVGTQWMRANRARYAKYCRGNVYIIDDPEQRTLLLEGARQQGRVLGIAFEAAETREKAEEIARGILE